MVPLAVWLLLNIVTANSKLLPTSPTPTDSRHLGKREAGACPVNNQIIASRECSAVWNETTQSFDISFSWTSTCNSCEYEVQLFQVFNTYEQFKTNNTFANFSFNPANQNLNMNIDGNLQVDFDGELCLCPVPLVIPQPSTIQEINIISLTTNSVIVDNMTSTQIQELKLRWNAPYSPTGDVLDLAYEIRVGAEDTINKTADFHSLTNIVTTELIESSLTGSVDEVISVNHTLNSQLYFQLRSSVSIGVNINLTSNWSSSQLLKEKVNSVQTSSMMSTSTIQSTSTYMIPTSQHTTTTISPQPSSSSSSTSLTPIPTTPVASGLQASVVAIAIVVPIIIIIAVVLLITTILCIFVMYRRKEKVSSETPTTEPQELFTLTASTDKWEIPPQFVHMQNCIGKGGFGKVYEAVIRGYTSPILDAYIQRNNHYHSVAVKTLKDDATEFDKTQFLKEIALMKKISESSNPHVVNMIGASTLENPLLLIIEFMEHGDLLNYLISCRKENERPSSDLTPLEESDVPSFAYQIASGMEYLTSMDLVHRDLACRNILMGEGKKLKITDFGLSRELDLESMYIMKAGGRFPVRWMAIESILHRKFTTKSDVWSFAVTLWEIGSLGETPYACISNDDLLNYIKSGQRLENPSEFISDEIYSIMKDCWSVRPSDRPCFSQLRKKFDSILSQHHQRNSQYYLEMSPPKACSLPRTSSTGSRKNLYVKVD